MKIEEIEIWKLIPYEFNNKIHDETQINRIANSIKEFWFLQPVVIDKNNIIIVWHGRVEGAKKLGLKKVPCIRAENLTETQIKKYRILDNKLNESAWDVDALKVELDELWDLNVWDIELKPDDLFGDLLIDDEEDPEVQEDEAPQPEKTAKIVGGGDLFLLWKHRLFCWDSTKEDDVETLIEWNLIDCVFTDPPYELQTQGWWILKNANSMKQIKENWVDTFDPSVLQMRCKTNIFCHNKPLIKKYIELAEKFKMPYDLWIYKKTNCVPNYWWHMMTDIEYIAIIWDQCPNKWLEKEEYSKIYVWKKDNDNKLSYSKPVWLCAKYIKLYSKKAVLDLFGWSWSTMIACEQLNRNCFMMELDPIYCEVIIKRFHKLNPEAEIKCLNRNLDLNVLRDENR